MNERNQALRLWLGKNLPDFDSQSLQLLAGDASFRRYFRLCSGGGSYVLMDAQSMQASCRPFVAIGRTFRQRGLLVPEVFYADYKQGFLLLSDFGDCQLLEVLSRQTVDDYYNKALSSLLVLQQCPAILDYDLPYFSVSLYQQELNLFRDWYLKRHQQRCLSAHDLSILDRVNDLLIELALSQPQVCVHRDYHSRNLMLLADGQLGMLDFQDAVWGPITYDAMSLLRDCYVAWPYEQVRVWLLRFQQQLLRQGTLQKDDPYQFTLWCDWVGLQRHLKCLGIFARLNYRDNKPAYMNNLPRMLAYARSVCCRYPEFKDLEQFLWG